MRKAIHHVLNIKAIEPVSKSQQGTGVYFMFFLVPKKNGDMRSILDLRWLNLFLIQLKFKMETRRLIVQPYRRGNS